MVATEPVIAQRWPIFHDRLITQTPVRGIVAVPLGDGLNGIGALDLYCHRSADVAAIDPTDVDAIAGHITTTLVHEQLFPDLRNGPFWDGPRWLNNPSITGRGYVLMAMGVISVALALPLADALAILRAHAFAADRTAGRRRPRHRHRQPVPVPAHPGQQRLTNPGRTSGFLRGAATSRPPDSRVGEHKGPLMMWQYGGITTGSCGMRCAANAFRGHGCTPLTSVCQLRQAARLSTWLTTRGLRRVGSSR